MRLLTVARGESGMKQASSLRRLAAGVQPATPGIARVSAEDSSDD